MWKKYLLLYVLTIVVTIASAASRTIGMEKLSLSVSFTLVALFTFIALKKTNGSMFIYAFLTILAGVLSIELFPRFLMSDTFYSLYSSFSILFGTVFGYTFFCISGKTQKSIFAVFVITFMCLYVTAGLALWRDTVLGPYMM